MTTWMGLTTLTGKITTSINTGNGVTVKSEDREDHSFNGIMFDISAGGQNKPLEFVLVESVWVRGGLGPMA
eukprot:gene14936-15329_t